MCLIQSSVSVLLVNDSLSPRDTHLPIDTSKCPQTMTYVVDLPWSQEHLEGKLARGDVDNLGFFPQARQR